MTMNGAVLPVLAMYIVAAEEQVRVKALNGFRGILIWNEEEEIPAWFKIRLQ